MRNCWYSHVYNERLFRETGSKHNTTKADFQEIDFIYLEGKTQKGAYRACGLQWMYPVGMSSGWEIDLHENLAAGNPHKPLQIDLFKKDRYHALRNADNVLNESSQTAFTGAINILRSGSH